MLPATSTGTRADRRASDRPAARSGRSCRSAASGWSRKPPRPMATRDRSRDRRDLQQVPQDAQRCGFRRLHPRDACRAERRHHHRASRCLRAGPDHRRLPAGALYGIDRLVEDKRAQRPPSRPAAIDEETIRLAGRARRADQGARRNCRNGRSLRLRYLAARRDRPGSGAVALLRVSRARSRSRTARR